MRQYDEHSDKSNVADRRHAYRSFSCTGRDDFLSDVNMVDQLMDNPFLSASRGIGSGGVRRGWDPVKFFASSFGYAWTWIPWTEEEHKLFSVGLQKVDKGDWRGISRNYVKTRTPSQVASHAQKYFLCRSLYDATKSRNGSPISVNKYEQYLSAVAFAVTTFGTVALMSGFFT
ncbi:uncharacterized protein [Medicago truncatula]|uniref:uncharacterized protein isoform X1 n=1 Tax=Medicago truncatula TaxID=3880 RepID=UPI001967AE1D|nr:uncharacterized protein LOC25495272 isoform X1 [Medicago truncatula]XP_039691134.1 uncharacterized protein LOC25495272 isoform X1 [Medicago truncatula]XP_039691135.1 uncharacterized protein LOC25495272 isoform X1 [Medicago truncatula]